MSPFRAKPGYTYKVKIRLPDGRSGTFTTGTRDLSLANAVEAFVTTLFRQRKWEALEAVISKRIKLPDIFDTYERGGMGAVDDLMVTLSAVDLSPLVDQLVEDEKYRTQIRRFIPANKAFPSSEFTRARVAAFLRELTLDRRRSEVPASSATKDRYKAAISAFAQALIEAEIIDSNPTRDISKRRKKGSSRQLSFLDPEEVQALVSVLPKGPFQALEALMAGSGIELGAALAMTVEDVDFKNRIVYARGTKNEYRNRYIEVTEDWAWEIFSEYARTIPIQTPLFRVSQSQALRQHANASSALGLPHTTLHNHRHSYAVMWIKRGVYGFREDKRDRQWLKNQLGHAPQSTLIDTRYGVYINAEKMTKAQKSRQGAATVIPITSLKKRAL